MMRLSVIAGGAVLVIVLGACGGGAASPVTTPTAVPPTPATTTPAPTATSSATDAARTPAEAFSELARGADWSLTGTVSGTVVTSWDGNDVYLSPALGALDVAGGDAHLLLVAPDATGIRVFEEIRIDGERNVRGPDGVWRAEAKIVTRDLLGALSRPGAVEAIGREEVEGRQLTVLRLAPADVGTLGGVRPDSAGPSADLEVLVADDGEPVVVRIAFAASGGMPSVETLEVAVTAAGDAIEILAPVPWRRQESPRGYSLVVPSECRAIEGDENWEQFHCERFYLRVWTAAATGVSPDEWLKDSVASWSEINGGEPVYLENVLRVGKGSSTELGWMATYQYEEDGTPVFMCDGVFMHDGTGYDLIVVGPAEWQNYLWTWFLQIAATMAFD